MFETQAGFPLWLRGSALLLAGSLLASDVCGQNLLANGSFNAGTTGWVPNNGSTLTWLPPPDSVGNVASGSIRLTTGESIAAVSSCVPATLPQNWPVRMSARLRTYGCALTNLNLVVFSTACGSTVTSTLKGATFGDLVSQEFFPVSLEVRTRTAGSFGLAAGVTVSGLCQVDLDEVVMEQSLFFSSFEPSN